MKNQRSFLLAVLAAAATTGIGRAQSLTADTSTLTEAAGTVEFQIDAGQQHAGKSYFLGMSVSGTFPGTPLTGGLVLPINFDAATQRATGDGAGPEQLKAAAAFLELAEDGGMAELGRANGCQVGARPTDVFECGCNRPG